MPAAQSEQFPVLESPPVGEVICGVQFDPLELDPLVLGVYWDRRKADYPQRSLQPAVTEGSTFLLGNIGNIPLRSVFVAADQVHVLQIQQDRFFMNWRAMGKAYPRFSNRGGGGGLLQQALDEFGRLSAYCEERFGRRPQARRVELAKIDVVEKGRHWRDLDHLEAIVPITGTFANVHQGGNRELALRFVENNPPKTLTVSVNSVAEKRGGDLTAIRIETRAVSPVADGDLEGSFIEANVAVNRAFFTLLGKEGLAVFGAKKGGG